MAGRTFTRHRPLSGTSRPSGWLAWFLVAFLALTPLPLGSTPPLAWAVWCLLLGLAATLYAFVQFRRGSSLTTAHVPPLPAGLFLVLCIYLALQALPLGSIFGPFAVTFAGGHTVQYDSISVAPGDTWLMLVRMVSFGLLFFLVRHVARDRKMALFLLRAIVIVVTAHALYGLVALFQLDDTLLGAPKWKYQGVATGSFLNRNSYATYLALGMAVAMSLAARSLIRRHEGRIAISLGTSTLLYMVSVAILITTIVLTNSRAGLAVACLGAFVVVVATVAYNARALRPLIIATPIALILFAGMFLTLGEQIWLRYEDSTVSFSFRLELYRQVAQLIALRPWMGFGGGAFEQAFPIVHASSLPNQLTWDKAHNTYLELWADLGLIGGSIPIILTAALAVLLVVRLARGQGSWAGQAAALAAIVVGAGHSLVDFSLEIEAVTFLFVAICAIGLAASQTRQKQE